MVSHEKISKINEEMTNQEGVIAFNGSSRVLKPVQIAKLY